MRKIGLPLLILVMIGLDQWVKFWVVAHIELGQMRAWLPGLVSLTYLKNFGAAFSILQNQQGLFTVITLVVISAAIYYYMKHIQDSYWLLVAISLIIAGGLGNFIDRIRLGYVVDMFHLDFMNFAIFNVADSYLTVGVAILFIYLWKVDDNGSSD